MQKDVSFLSNKVFFFFGVSPVSGWVFWAIEFLFSQKKKKKKDVSCSLITHRKPQKEAEAL